MGGIAQGQKPEDRRGQRQSHPAPHHRVPRLHRGVSAIRQSEPVNGDAAGHLNGRENQQRLAPAEAFHQYMGERNEHRAGEPTEQCDGDDAAPVIVFQLPRHDGENGLIEHRREHHAHQRPDRIELPQAADLRPDDEERGRGDGTRRHQMAPAIPVDGASGEKGGKPRHGETERQGTIDGRLRPAEFRRHGPGNYREGVIERAPGNQLGKGQRQHETPAEAGTGLRCGPHPAAAATVSQAPASAHPQPGLPLCLATASAWQQSSAPAAAGPPQQPPSSS